MSISMHRASAPILLNVLQGLSIVLTKAEAFARENNLAESDLLEARLAPDMYTACRQVQIATDNAKGMISRLAGREVPSWADTESTFTELLARVQKAIDLVAAVPANEIDGSELREIELKQRSGSRFFTGERYLIDYAIPNFMFHATTAYAIFRMKGVQIGKKNYLGHE